MTLSYPAVPIGTMVRFTAPGSRNTEGVPRIIPAVVLGQWADGSLQLYALHFEGAFLVNSIPYADVEILSTDLEGLLQACGRRMAEMEEKLDKMMQEIEDLQKAWIDSNAAH
jgi:hypothetical protein